MNLVKYIVHVDFIYGKNGLKTTLKFLAVIPNQNLLGFYLNSCFRCCGWSTLPGVTVADYKLLDASSTQRHDVRTRARGGKRCVGTRIVL